MGGKDQLGDRELPDLQARRNEWGTTSKLHEEVTSNLTLLSVLTLAPTFRSQHSVCYLQPFGQCQVELPFHRFLLPSLL